MPPGGLWRALGGSWGLLGTSRARQNCSKSTLLRLLAGFESPTKGVIEIDGQDMAGVAPADRPVNFMFQNYALFPHCLFVDAAMARRPPLDARVALAAAQQVVYARNDSKRRKHDLALFHRVFKARQHYFTEAFRRKVSDRYQWLTFLRKAGA